jgi:type VI secretion system protein ImpF
MAERDLKITPSILDRLVDREPENTNEAARSRYYSLRELKQSVRRDVETLLNTRITDHASIDENLEEVRRSVVCYGLPDFTSVGANNPEEQARITGAIREAIEIFEPRFIGVTVRLEPLEGLGKQVRFRIEANLDVEPSPEPIIFDTVLKPGSGEFSVEEKRS